MAMFSASTLIQHLRFFFNGQRIEPDRPGVVPKRRPKSSPSMEPLEDRRLLSYTIINLGSLGGTASVPVEVNNHGEVIGYSFTADNAAAHAFLYSHGRMTDLGTLGGMISGATGINDRGTVVGLSNVAPGNSQVDAFVERGGKLTDLGPLSPAFAEGGIVSINAGGDISGLSAGGYDALIHRHGINIELGSLAGLGSIAKDINDSGQVVGFSTTALLPPANGSSTPTAIFHAFLYSHGSMSDLGTLGGTDSSANAINDRGAVVGFSYTANNVATHAFVYRNGTMTDLGTIGGRDSIAAAINDKGTIVGTSLTSTGASHAFIDVHGRMADLNSEIPAQSGFVITTADDINDRGQIAVRGYKTSAPTRHLALLLNPRRS
jgi:probable HAF family extracellular repeat protein